MSSQEIQPQHIERGTKRNPNLDFLSRALTALLASAAVGSIILASAKEQSDTFRSFLAIPTLPVRPSWRVTNSETPGIQGSPTLGNKTSSYHYSSANF